MRYDGTLTAVSRSRVECALSLYHAGIAPRLIMTGKSGFVLPKPVSEAEALARHARARGVPEGALVIEDHARDTLGNARHTLERYLRPNHWRRVRIVTSAFHERRAAAVFRAVLGSEYEHSFTVVPSGVTPAELVLRLLEPVKLAFLPNVQPVKARHTRKRAKVH